MLRNLCDPRILNPGGQGGPWMHANVVKGVVLEDGIFEDGFIGESVNSRNQSEPRATCLGLAALALTSPTGPSPNWKSRIPPN